MRCLGPSGCLSVFSRLLSSVASFLTLRNLLSYLGEHHAAPDPGTSHSNTTHHACAAILLVAQHDHLPEEQEERAHTRSRHAPAHCRAAPGHARQEHARNAPPVSAVLEVCGLHYASLCSVLSVHLQYIVFTLSVTVANPWPVGGRCGGSLHHDRSLAINSERISRFIHDDELPHLRMCVME